MVDMGDEACSDTEPDRATNEIQPCERASHVNRGRVYENVAKKNKKAEGKIFIWFQIMLLLFN